MKKDNNIIEVFENIRSIEPSTEWNERLWKKLEDRDEHRGIRFPTANQLFLAAIIILTAVNIFSFSESRLIESRKDNKEELRKIAAEILISSNSSKY